MHEFAVALHAFKHINKHSYNEQQHNESNTTLRLRAWRSEKPQGESDATKVVQQISSEGLNGLKIRQHPLVGSEMKLLPPLLAPPRCLTAWLLRAGAG